MRTHSGSISCVNVCGLATPHRPRCDLRWHSNFRQFHFNYFRFRHFWGPLRIRRRSHCLGLLNRSLSSSDTVCFSTIWMMPSFPLGTPFSMFGIPARNFNPVVPLAVRQLAEFLLLPFCVPRLARYFMIHYGAPQFSHLELCCLLFK